MKTQVDLVHPLIDIEIYTAVLGAPGQGSTPTGSIGSMTPDAIPQLREQIRASLVDDETISQGGRIEFEDFSIPGLDGDPDIPAILLRPAGLVEPRPVLCVTHCGGKVVSSPRLALDSIGILRWVMDFNLIVIVAAVRVGPEDPHPAQVRDGYAAYTWAASNADRLGAIDGEVSLAGISGGGGVAAGTALYARDNGAVAPKNLILYTPMLDDRAITPSSHFEDVIWDRVSNQTGWQAMLGDDAAGPDVSPYAAPSRAEDLSGLPPTYLETGSADTFRDETIDFGARLAQAGVPVDLHVWAGAMHGSDGINPAAEVSVAAVATRASFFRRAFGDDRDRYIKVPN